MPRQQTAKLEAGSYINDIRILSFAGYKSGRQRYECECACGNVFIAYKEHLISHRTQKCPSCSAGKDLIGQVISGWKIEYRSGTAKTGHKIWRCRCIDCGAVRDIDSLTLRRKAPACAHQGREVATTDEDEFSDFFNAFG